MNKQQPINFINNHFVFSKGEREYFRGQKEYTSLPNREKLVVNNTNLWRTIAQIYIPVSQMCASIKDYQFCNSLDGTEKIGFYDIETNDEEDFELGFVNSKLFTDPKEMVEHLLKYDIIVGFNIYRFDNEVLHKYAPECFIEVSNKDFIAHSVKGVLNIDLFAMVKLIVGKESYGAVEIARGLGFDKEIPEYEEKEEKCKIDIEINKFIWEKYNIPKAFNMVSSLINTDTTLWQIVKPERVRKWILINKYLREGFAPLKKPIKEITLTATPIKFAKQGFYTDYKYLDISSTYPKTAINIGNLGVYDDDLFSKLQEELFEFSKDKELKPFSKSIANPLCGAMYSKNEFFRNEEIFEKIVSSVVSDVQKVIDSRDDVVYVNTDCWVVPKDSPDIKIENYEIKKDYEFTELYVYNANKWLGKCKGEIVSRGFKKLNSRDPHVLKIAREEIYKRLKKAKDQDFLEILESPEELVKTTLSKLKKMDIKDLKMSVRKNSESCWNLELSIIWKKMKKGFNDYYYKGHNDFTLDEKKINRDYYKELILNLAEEYMPEK